MSNIKLKDHNWAAEGIYDTNQSKSQQTINSDVNTKIGQATLQTSSKNLSGATNELKGRADTLDSKYDNVVTVANTQPSSEYNKVWLPLTVSEGTQVPTWAEHQALESSLNGAINDRISDASTTNLLDIFTKTNETLSGVTVTWLGDGSVKVNGTSSATNWNTVYQSTTQMPSGITAGQTYKASMKTTYEKLYLMILAYTGSWTVVLNTASSTSVSFTVPSNATGFWIRVNIQGGYTFSNAIAKPVIYATGALSNTINTKISEITGYTGDLDIDSVVNYAIGALTTYGLTNKMFTFRANRSSNGASGYFGTSAYSVLCYFSSSNYGYGLLLSDNTKNIASFRRTDGVNYLLPIGDAKVGTLIASDYFGNTFSKTYTLQTGVFSLWLIGYGTPGGSETAKGQYVITVGAAGNVAVHPILVDNKFSFTTNTFQINITTSTARYTGVILSSMTN